MLGTLRILICVLSCSYACAANWVANNLHGKLKGSIVALVTPMDESGALDITSYTNLMKWHVNSGADCCVVLGTTGEGQLVSVKERHSLVRTAVNTCGGSFRIIVGAGAIDTETTVHQCQDALSGGAHATLVLTPPYVKPPQRALVDHYTYLANKVSLPMLVYNCPGRTGVDMSVETIAELSFHPNIVGVKEASGDISRVAALRSLCERDFILLSGDDATAYDFVRLGGDGVISVTANVVPALMHGLMQAATNGSDEGAALQVLLKPLHQSLFLESNPIPVKKALTMMGKIGGGIRQPLCALDPKHERSLRDALISCGAL